MNIDSIDPALEINREGVQVVVDGFKGFTLIAHQILISEGVGKDDGEGNLVLPQDAWLNLKRYLSALERIGREVGSQVLYEGGCVVPKYAQLPPTIRDIFSALGSLDVAFHMNHRKDGAPLFDLTTGKMQEGIGHYVYNGKPGTKRIQVVSDSPYPCDYDRGIVYAMAKRFEPTANTVHEAGCRKKGAPSCTYTVTWR